MCSRLLEAEGLYNVILYPDVRRTRIRAQEDRDKDMIHGVKDVARF